MTAHIPLDARLTRLLEEGERFAILTHINPDGDGLGSELALHAFLRDRGKQARVINDGAIPANYRFLRLAPQVETLGEEGGAFVEEADGVFILDNGSMERLGALVPHVKRTRGLKVCIDHHETQDDCWDIDVIDSDASASGEIVFQIIRQLGGSLTTEIAEALYVSIITDTGHFRFSKTRPLSHRITAELLETGIDPAAIYEQVYERKSEGAIRLLGHALASMKRDDGGKLAWTALEAAVLRRLDAEDEDTGWIINTLLSMEGIRLSILCRELPDGQVKVSLRSKGDVDVSRFAQRHGGGGHRNASGILLPGPLDAATRRLVAEGLELVTDRRT